MNFDEAAKLFKNAGHAFKCASEFESAIAEGESAWSALRRIAARELAPEKKDVVIDVTPTATLRKKKVSP